MKKSKQEEEWGDEMGSSLSGWHIYKTDGLSERYWWIFLQDKNGNPGLKIDQGAADLSGSATPLEYKRLTHQDILTHSFTKKKKKKNHFASKMYVFKSVMFSI